MVKVDITVEVAYKVGYGNMEIPKKVYNGLKKIAKKGGEIGDNNTWQGLHEDDEVLDAWEWLAEAKILERKHSCEQDFKLVEFEDTISDKLK